MVVCLDQRKVVANSTRKEIAGEDAVNSSGFLPTDFRFFPRLPLELQRAIWRECLPRRIVTFFPDYRHAIFDDSKTDTCHVPKTLYLRRTSPPPLIAQVCREARVVALEHGGLCHIDRRRGGRYTFPPISAWFDSSTDIMMPSGVLAEVCPVKTPINSPHSSTIAFPFKRLRTSSHTAFKHLGRECRCFGDRLGTIIIVRHVKIHATQHSVLDSGLFGMFGEETIALVDLHDRERLLSFCKIDQHQERPGSQPRIREVLEEIELDDSPGETMFGTGFARMIRIIIEDHWLDHHIFTAPADEDRQRDPSIYPANAESTFERYDRSHWWVRDTLQNLVSFEPKIAVELCKPSLEFI